MSVVQIIWPMARSVLASALPNLLLLLVIGANYAWWIRTGPLGYIGAGYFEPTDIWLESVLTVGAVIAIDISAISLFARRWRARRWGKKPPEIERATRYIQG